MSKIKNGIFYLEYLLFRFLSLIVNLIPIRLNYRINLFLAPLIFPLLGKRKQTAIDNLKRVFGHEKSDEEIKRIAVGSLANIFHVVCEFVRTPTYIKDPFKYMDLKGWNFIEDGLKQRKGVILLAHHYENWEVDALAPHSMNCVLHVIARPLKNVYVYNYIKKLRECYSLKVIDKKGAVRSAMKLLKQNQIVVFLIDQHERETGIWIDFMGIPACTSSMPAWLALNTGAPVLPIFFMRNIEGKFTVQFEEHFQMIKTGDGENDVRANTELLLKPLEKHIKEKPESWLWMHRRWRKPPVENEVNLNASRA